MKTFLRSLVIGLMITVSAFISNAQQVVTLSGSITANTTLDNTNIYLLQGFVYVRSGATLTIPAGTLIKGDRTSKGTLIIERGAKIMAQGTAALPIVFTSNQAPGLRSYGDWGGVVICGNATQNQPGSPIIEGGVGSAFGGTDDTDNSGVLSYVRIEFAGIPLVPGNEINGLTMGAVGSGTTIDHVQVSYCGDDAFEWFGGTVNAKHLISFRTWDDDFDTDFGFRGNVQFGLALRDPKVADQSRSNFFEADNDATGSDNTPFSASTFSNITAAVIPGPDTLHRLNGRDAHLRRNTRSSIFNSVLAGMNTGILLDGAKCEANASSNALELNNNILHARRSSSLFQVATGSTFLSTLASWFTTGRGNDTTSVAPAIAYQALGVSANFFNLQNPDFSITAPSLMATGAAFTSGRLASSFFDRVTYRGAINPANPTDWMAGWTNFDPLNTNYSAPLSLASGITTKPIALFPNPTSGNTTLVADVATATEVNLMITDLTGRKVMGTTHALEAGSNMIPVQTTGLPNGIYNVSISNGRASSTQRLVISQ